MAAETRSTDSNLTSGEPASMRRTTALRVLELLFPYFRLRSLLLLISIADWAVFITTLAIDSEMPLVPSSKAPRRCPIQNRAVLSRSIFMLPFCMVLYSGAFKRHAFEYAPGPPHPFCCLSSLCHFPLIFDLCLPLYSIPYISTGFSLRNEGSVSVLCFCLFMHHHSRNFGRIRGQCTPFGG